MPWKGLRICLAMGLVAGCAHSGTERAFPPDPLLLSKHPVTGKFDGPSVPQVALIPPSPPPVPDPAFAETEQKPGAERVVPATPVSNHPEK